VSQSKKQSQAEYLDKVESALESGVSADLHRVLSDMHPADIADLLEAVPPGQRHSVWAEVEPEHFGEVLVEVAESVRLDLIQDLDDDALVQAVSSLDTDDIADLIPIFPDDLISRILFAMSQQDRQRLNTVLSYPDDTAGGLMNVDVVTIRADISLGVVLRYIRMHKELPEDTNKLFIVDKRGSLVGSMLLTRLLTLDTDDKVSEVMDTEITSFGVLTPAKEVAAAFERYDLISAPVIDESNRLVGRITVDDVVDVIREEADRSVMAPAGLREDEDIFAPVARSTRNRAVWLGVNLITAILASWVIGLFEETIQKAVALAVLMPIVASMGGNAGTQTLTLVIRGMALGTVKHSNASQVLARELMVSVWNSVIWALVVGVVAVIWYKSYTLGLVIAMAMGINLVIAASAGVIIPLLIRRLGIDPALASGVALTTLTDVAGFLAFLGLAAIFLV
jgi:magnesium transporter